MKRVLILLFALSALLSGCSALDGQYVRVTPHVVQSTQSQEQAGGLEDYAHLRDALTNMVASGIESQVFLTKDYPEESLYLDMNAAKRYISTIDAVGAYAVEDVAYEIGTKNGNLAVAVAVSYRHSRSDIRSITKLSGMDGVEAAVLKAMESLDSRKVLLVSDYQPRDFAQLVQNLSQTNPQTVMECPVVAADVFGQGQSRVIELMFTYENATDALRLMHTQVEAVFDSASLYVSGDGEEGQKYAQLYSFLMDRFRYKLETSITPSYSLLRHGVGDSRAFATVYAAMCRNAGLECQVVTGTRDAEPWNWNIICDNGVYYHVDLTRCKEDGSFQEKADYAMTGYVWDYSAFPVCGTGNMPETLEPSAEE